MSANVIELERALRAETAMDLASLSLNWQSRVSELLIEMQQSGYRDNPVVDQMIEDLDGALANAAEGVERIQREADAAADTAEHGTHEQRDRADRFAFAARAL